MSKNPTFRQIANTPAGKAAGLKAPKEPDNPEERLQEAMALLVEWMREKKWLWCPDLVYFSPNERSSKRQSGRMKALGVRVGVPDWHIGHDLKIETKSLTGSLSPAQKRFRDQWMKAGGVFEVCRSMERFAEFLLYHAAHPTFECVPYREGQTFEMAVKELAEKARLKIVMAKGPVP